ncbi:dipeptidyl peptidase 8 [Biomphalaria glabrata]|nr:dipeptidyl peptidase 8-like [Biomphalaria glabrata]
MIIAARKIVCHFKHSSSASDRLHNLQSELDLPHQLIQDVNTRWNSTFLMLKRLLEQRRAITLYCAENEKLSNLSPSQWSVGEKVAVLLQPFEEVTREREGNDKGIKNMKSTLLECLNSRFENLDNNRLYSIATFLDPRFKSLVLNENACTEAKAGVLICATRHQNPVTESVTQAHLFSEAVEPPTKKARLAESSLWDCFDELVVQEEASVPTVVKVQSQQDMINEELSKYLSEPLIHRKDDPVLWWKVNASRFPGLAKVAQIYLAPPPTSVPSERLFSIAGRIINDYHGRKMYRLLYEEVDETDVEILSIFSPTGQEPNCSELYRYPKAGANNAYSNLKLLEIIISFSGAITQVEDIQVKDLCMKEALFDACPWAEYLSRAGWTPDGKYIYAVLIDRLQMRQAVMLISPSIFYTATTPGSCSSFIQCIYEETSDIWINVHDLLHFFPQTSENEISFVYASEKSGYRHLYLIKSQLCLVMNGNKSLQIGQGDQTDSYVSCKVISEVPITSGQWVVLPKELWVDESKHLVYFMALKDSPLESHLYVTRYDQPSPVQQLTQPCHSHSVHISQDFSKYVTVYSSLNSPPQSAVYKIVHTDWGHIRASYLGSLTPKIDTFGYTPPNLFQYPSRAGHVAYGLYFLPRMREPGKRYPTVLFVYGGPQVQMVSNSFKGQRFLRLHTLAAEGYVVVVIDGRGSSNRGLHFEGVLKNSLGTVEITDQVEGLLWLASQNDFIDMSRVAIHGWSYGGYLSLMGLAQRGDIFKVAIAGAPVVSWELYDTGYTERYIGLPQSNPDVYKAGNVLTYIDMLPDNETKLLLIHGLIDENVHFRHSSVLINHLVTSCKPHQLQIYPNERHGIRNHEASEHYKTTVLKFLQDYL